MSLACVAAQGGGGGGGKGAPATKTHIFGYLRPSAAAKFWLANPNIHIHKCRTSKWRPLGGVIVLCEMKRTGTLWNGTLRNDSIVDYSGATAFRLDSRLSCRVDRHKCDQKLNQTQRTQAVNQWSAWKDKQRQKVKLILSLFAIFYTWFCPTKVIQPRKRQQRCLLRGVGRRV